MSSVIMNIKKVLRRSGYDIVTYHPQYQALLKQFSIGTVLDIGANDGQFALDVRAHVPAAEIYSFEPLKDQFDKLCRRFAGQSNFHPFNVALGESNTTTTIKRSAFSPSSSLLDMTEAHKKLYPKSAAQYPEEINLRRLDDMKKEMRIRGNLLVKIDVQGYEAAVIKGGAQIISKAVMVVVETSFLELYAGQPLFDDVYQLLRPLGFSYHGHKEQHWNEKTNELIYEDSIFVKDASR